MRFIIDVILMVRGRLFLTANIPFLILFDLFKLLRILSLKDKFKLFSAGMILSRRYIQPQSLQCLTTMKKQGI